MDRLNRNILAKVVTVCKFEYPTKARMAQMKLKAEGIKSWLSDELSDAYIDEMDLGSSPLLGGVKLQVRESDAEKAKAIISGSPEK